MKRLMLPLLITMMAAATGCGNQDTANNDNQAGDSTTVEQQPASRDTTAVRSENTGATDGTHNDFTPPPASDSVQFCYITKLYSKGGNNYIDADYIQYYYGDKAVEEARKHHKAIVTVDNGDTTFSLPDGTFVVNENKKIRTLRLRDDATFMELLYEPELALKPVTLEIFKKNLPRFTTYILKVHGDSVVTAIKPQYEP